MFTMEPAWSPKDLVVTQISVGGFGDDVTAKNLVEYFYNKRIESVIRCRLKTSSTPLDSYPAFDIDCKRAPKRTDYEKVKPHAFLHLSRPEAVKDVLDAESRGELTMGPNSLKVSQGPKTPWRLNEMRRNHVPFRFSDVTVEIGVLARKDEFFVAWRGPDTGYDFLIDPFNSTCSLVFTRETAFAFKGESRYAVIKCDFKVEFLLREILSVKRYQDYASLPMLLQLSSAPSIYYRTADDDIEVLAPYTLLDDDDPWIRTTDFTPSGAIGRCNTYRISVRARHGGAAEKAFNFLRESSVRVEDVSRKQKLKIKDEPDFGVPLSDPFFCIQYKEGITFKVLFMVNAVLHKGIINQHQMSDTFFELMRWQKEEVNLVALKNMYSSKWPIHDACEKLESLQKWLRRNPKLVELPKQADDLVEVRRLVITPSKAYCLPPEVELSNRVLRKYRDVSDRFLRVTFMDESMKMLNKNVLNHYAASIVWELTKTSNLQKTAMYRKVLSILSDGFYLCGRKYSFLAFSSNQLRDHSAWFFAEGENILVADILNWMGKFTNRNVAKCAARMGQCFSSTYATVEVPILEADLKHADVERNGYCFSDGIGMISSDLAMQVAERLKLSDNPPCAYQIRYAGFKGVVACWPPKKPGICLYLRESMRKFDSTHKVLEICSWTRFQPGFLNRQIITLLSALDVQDKIFWDMQESMISKLNMMLEDPDVAFDVLTASCSPDQGNTAAIMLSAGFKPGSEPHLKGVLTSIRAAQLRDLREKARIFVPHGRWLMGCLDELPVLEQGQCFIQVSNPSLENCFSKHGSKFSEATKHLKVITGLVVIAKNPCLHPGDVRILEAVDIPGLHHLNDCLVFPQKGDRPHPNEASGSDLDGDLYFVTWDENLVPPSKRSWMPMDYTPGETKKVPRAVTRKDIIDFFSKNMVTESLGAICNAHVVHADQSEYGALDKKCLKLAELAATAVDFPKTGKVVIMPSDCKPAVYPDFMGKEDFQTYRSNKILGRMYRNVKDACHEVAAPDSTLVGFKIPYDKDLEVPGYEAFTIKAWLSKTSYDAQLNRLLAQYRVNREEEVVCGHVWSMPKASSKKVGDLKDRLKYAYNNLKKVFRRVFEDMDSGFDLLSDDEKCAIYERKASAWYYVTYHPIWVRKAMETPGPNTDASPADAVMLSFPWIAVDYLAQIKLRRRGVPDVDSKKPIDALCKYLADKL